MLSIMGTIEETIINIGFIKLNPIDNVNKLVFKIKRAYLRLFNLIYLCLISI